MVEFIHTPVLLEEILSYLPENPEYIMDFTLGGGNHSQAMLSARKSAHLLGVDRDPDAIQAAGQRLNGFEGRYTLINDSMANAAQRFVSEGQRADFILADLGVSSHQLESINRGFSFRHDGPLDMRMDKEQPLNAADIVNDYSEKELINILKLYGEERFSSRIAQRIVHQREKKRFSSTRELADCIKESVPKKFQFGKLHPATKSFQAIRIVVNDELKQLQTLLECALDLLNPNGRIAIISFHSLEDRPVKQTFQKWEDPCQCSKSIPVCVCGETIKAKRVVRSAVKASEAEMENNYRSRSARLRVTEKI